MSLEAILDLEKSLVVTKAFNDAIFKLNAIRQQNSELFFDTIINFMGDVKKMDDYHLLMNKLKLSDDEELKLGLRIIELASPEEKEKFAVLFLSSDLKREFQSIKVGKNGNHKFQQLSFEDKEKILTETALADEEIKLMLPAIRAFFKKEQNAEELFLSIGQKQLTSIVTKINAWKLYGFFESAPEKNGEDLLQQALKHIVKEKNFKKPSDLKRYVEARIEKMFLKNVKPFTDEQVSKGVSWYFSTNKKISIEKDKSDYRSRSRVNVTSKHWNDFMLQLFGTKVPAFASKYKKSVLDEVRKKSKHQVAQNSTK